MLLIYNELDFVNLHFAPENHPSPLLSEDSEWIILLN